MGGRVGLTPPELDGLDDYATSPAYGALERLVIRYAEQLTVSGEVDDTLYAMVAAHLSPRQMVELAFTVAAANFSNRLNAALKLNLEDP